MKYEELRIVFMGTPDFAVASLDALVESGAQIAGVITAPDKPAGRGMQLRESPVKQYAVRKGLNILQPEKLKDPAFLSQLKDLRADLQVVVAFRMLPELVWNMPPLGTINVHGSLLPKYRGAAPINWAIINGEQETGVTTFKLKQEIDTGDILLQQAMPIGPDETAGEVHDRMMYIGADLLVHTIKGLAEGTLNEQPQNTSEASIPAPKIFFETCVIDWNRPMDNIYNHIRGLCPYPAAISYIEKKLLKIYKVEKQQETPSHQPGEIDTDYRSYLRFACQDGYILLKELQLEGKKRMNTADFLRGYRVSS